MDKENSIYIIDNISYDNLWSFYLYDKTLYYCKDKNYDKESIKIIDDVKTFDLCIDAKQKIHILCVINSGELIYLVLQNDICNKKLLQSFPQKANSIDQVKILAVDDAIHIFYNFRIIGKNIRNYNYKSFIIHSYKTKYEWMQSYIGTFHQSISPNFFVDIDSNKTLHFFYLSIDQKTQSINSLVFPKYKATWFKAKNIKLSTHNIKLLNVFNDSNDRIHYIFQNSNSMGIYHQCISTSEAFQNPHSLVDGKTIDSLEFNIFEVNKQIWISWLTENHISYIYSQNFGETWTDVSEYTADKIKKIQYFFVDYDSNASKVISTFGFIDDLEAFVLGINEIRELENEAVDVNYSNDKLLDNSQNNEEVAKEKQASIKNSENLEDKEKPYIEHNNPELDDDILPAIPIECEKTSKNSNAQNDILPDKEFSNKDIDSKKINKISIWKKITNYLTLRE